MAEQEWEVVVNAALAVVQVGVAHTACLHLNQRFARARVGHDDGGELNRLAFAPRDDALNLVCHELPLGERNGCATNMPAQLSLTLAKPVPVPSCRQNRADHSRSSGMMHAP